jgi:hypothetical protein
LNGGGLDVPYTEQPGPTARQESGRAPDGSYILSVLAKRTYSFADTRELVLADEQVPLCEEPVAASDDSALLVQDTDLFAYKPRTDVVIVGHVYNYDRRTRVPAAVRIGDALKQILVIGDRRCSLGATGEILFSSPAPFDRVPLAYTHAYGGRDVVAEAEAVAELTARWPDLPPEFLPTEEGSVFLYPRNPSGRGYLITRTARALEQLELPNLEDPFDQLSPDRLEVGATLRWPRMPLPQATGWVSYEWFPRVVGIGILPPYERMDAPFPEVARGYIPDHVLRPAPSDQADPFHLTCGASLGLQLPYLHGDELVVLQHMHPALPEIAFRLPADRPRIWTDGRKGKLNATDPVIHTLVVEPDEQRLSLVWRGSAPALRPYLPEELARMPFRVEW